MRKEDKCLNHIVRVCEDFPCFKKGMVGLVTADLEDVFAVFFHEEDMPDLPRWVSFDVSVKKYFEVVS